MRFSLVALFCLPIFYLNHAFNSRNCNKYTFCMCVCVFARIVGFVQFFTRIAFEMEIKLFSFCIVGLYKILHVDG